MFANAPLWAAIMYVGMIIMVAGTIICLTVWCCIIICERYQPETSVDHASTAAREMDLENTSDLSGLHRAAVVALSNTRRQ